MNFDSLKIKLELKSKFFKDTLLAEIQKNKIEIISKKVVPHYKVNFIINLMVRTSEAKKLKNLIKQIETLEKDNEAILLEQKRKEYKIYS